MAKHVAAVSIALALAAPAGAQEAIGGPVPQFIHQRLQSNTAEEQFVAAVVGELRQHDRNGDGLDVADVTWLERTTAATARANALSQVMRYDLDGDLKVGAAEVRETVNAPEASQGRTRAASDRLGEQNFQRAMEEVGWFDTNGDGVVTVREAASVPSKAYRARGYRVEAPRMLMALPDAADGRLTAQELGAYGRRLFAAADRDGDGVLSDVEAEAARATNTPMEIEREGELTCRLPQPRSGDLIALVGVAEGGGARPRNAAYARPVTLQIAPGTRPLYIVATSGDAVRWMLEGDVGRVARFVAMAEPGARRGELVSIVGLDAPVAQIRNAYGCIPAFVSAEAQNGLRAAKLVRDALGRGPDMVVGAGAPERLVLPPTGPKRE